MGYIPKYIIKRMLPKNAVKLAGSELKIEMTNVISPLSIDEIPDDVLNYLEVKVDGNVVLSGEKPDLAAGLKLMLGDQTFTMENIKSAVGVTLPIGGMLNIVLPNPGLAVGETHDFEVTIKTDNPINIKFEREVCE